MARLSVFHVGDDVRLIDNTVASVLGGTTRKNYYLIDSAVHGRVIVFAGDMEKIKHKIREEVEDA